MSAEGVFPNPGYDADMLRRAVEACQNATNAEWFSWVARHLEQLAERFDHMAALSATDSPRDDTPTDGDD